MSKLLQILAALNSKQKKAVDELYHPHHGFSDHAMGGAANHRVEIPLKAPNIIAPKHIVKALGEAGHKEVNYSKGVVKDKYGREVKIGKALAKAGKTKELKDYENDPQRSASKNHKIIISRHPHDVAAMSTGQGWTSCMNLDDGMYRNYIPKDIKEGTHVAYLVHKNDNDLNHPVARIALKPYTSKNGHTILRPEKRTYGTANSNFHKSVTEWAKKHFPLQATEYNKNPKLYNDSGNENVYHARKIGKQVLDSGKLGPHFKHLTVEEQNKIIRKSANPRLINSFFKNYAEKVHPKTFHRALAKGVKVSPLAREALKSKYSKVREHIIAEDRKKGKTPGPEPKTENLDPRKDISYNKWLNNHTNAERKEIADHHYKLQHRHYILQQKIKQKALKKYRESGKGYYDQWGATDRALKMHPELEKQYEKHSYAAQQHFSKYLVA